MKAVACKDQQLALVERPTPVPGRGQLLLRVLRCGICGSDLHVRQHCDHWGALMVRSGYTALTSSAQEVVFGHEFSGEVLDHGPGTKGALKAGTPVVALPLLRRGQDIDLIGLSARIDGAYAEQMLVEAALTMAIPNGLSPDVAALTEPLAVGLHAVEKSGIKARDVALVLGCGPVGLAVICMLKARGVRHIIASDFSAARRALAAKCGATRVLDPAQNSPWTDWKGMGFIHDAPQLMELAVGTMETLNRPRLPWWQVWAAAELLGVGRKRPVIFECVGVPGMLQHIIDGAPQFSRVVVVGVCMQADALEPSIAINKEIELLFSLGYTPPEFRRTLHLLAEGKVDATPLITGTVGLEGVGAAFDTLAGAQHHAKILIDPQKQGAGGL